MASRARKLEILFTGDNSSLSRSVRSTNSMLGQSGRSFSKFGKIAAAGIGAAAVAAGAMVVSVGRDLMNMERLNAQTRTAIRSSGGAANVTQRQVTALANTIQDFSGIQAESIQEGQNLLLTFHNIRNEAGAGNDIFNRTTRIMADMSTAMGTDAAGTAIQLGKALNDPIRGLSALTRVGVTFTDRQKDWIEHLVETGDTIGAQRVILSELQSEFGGSAQAFGETTAGQFARIRESLGDVAEGLVVKLMPALAAAGNWIRTKMIPAIAEFGQWLGPRLQPALEAVVGWFKDNWPQISETVTNVFNNVKGVVTDVVSFLQTLWQTFGDDILSHIQRVWPTIQQIITGVMQTIQGVIHVVSSLIKGDWGEVWEGIKTTFKGVWNVIVGVVRNSIQTVRTVIGAVWQIVESITKGTWRRIRTFLTNIWDGIKDGVRALKDGIGSIWNGLKAVLAAPVNWIIRNVVNPFLGFIRTVANFVGLGGHVPGPFGSIGGARDNNGGLPPGTFGPPTQGGDGPGMPRMFGGGGRAKIVRQPHTGDGLGDLFSPNIGEWAGLGGGLPAMLQKVKDAIEGIRNLLGLTGGPPPYKGIMGGLMTAPMREALDFLNNDLKKRLEAPALTEGIGWKAMWNVVQQHFPDAWKSSDLRPGAITATGNVSYHSSGRAIDIGRGTLPGSGHPATMELFNWIRGNYMAQTKELIYSAAPHFTEVHNGQNHDYTGITDSMHYDHVHWAMARGTPGWVKVRQPTAFVAGEAGTEYMNISRGAPGGGGATFHFHFHGPVSNEQQAIAWVDKALKQGIRSPELQKLIRAG